MPEFARVPLQGTGPGLFSASEIQRLMRVEFDRAQRYHYPLVCLLIAVDRLERYQDLYGGDFKNELLKGVQSLLRATVRESDLIGTVIDDRLLVLVTHTPPEGARSLAQRLLEGARKLYFRAGTRTVRITLSIGGAHNQHGTSLFFETLIEVAGGGLQVAQGGGGDRFVHSELYAFFQEKHERDKVARPDPFAGANVQPLTATAPIEASEGRPEVLRGIVAEEGPRALAEHKRAQEQIFEAIRAMQKKGVGGADFEEQLEQLKRQNDVLERRIAKLTQLLAMTEDELRRLIDAKSIDPGVESIYKTVQGLQDGEGDAKVKRELMKRIFQANLELKQQLSSGN